MRRLRELALRPQFTTDLLQILKSVVAATAAWWVSTTVLSSPLPFLAPWTALLTVHATVHRSLSRGVQSTVASTLGVGLSFLVGAYLGVSVWTFALALFVGLAGARISWIRDEGIAIATTAIFVLGSGFSEQQPLLLDRIIEVGLGVGIGVAVNLLVIPPLRDQQASRYVDSINRRIGDVLVNMADEFSNSWETDKAEAWREEIESMTHELNTAWQSARFATESRRYNPRARLARRSRPGEEVSYENILERVDEGISHLRHLARTLYEAAYAEGAWDEDFRERWTTIVRDTGLAVADPDADVEPVLGRLTALARDLSHKHDLPAESWPLYGSLLSGVRHIVVIIDDVASAREAREAGASNPRTSGSS
ncbi:FUSC family protein [Georgenia sp. Z1491]|uniref:FUSC family protein n=1 Tax=Georgenia sp. Z1491 TaxID=3416707 RepID=UPI003CFB2829